MRQAYQDAGHYRDQAVARLQYVQQGEAFTDEAPIAVGFSRPNRLSIRAYQARIDCDGEHFLAMVEDPSTADFDGQVVHRPAEKRLTLASLVSDTVLAEALGQGLCRLPIQLELLLSDSPTISLQDPGITKELLQPEIIAGQACHRVRLSTSQGDFVAWIRAADLVLRRLEFPTEKLTTPGASDIRLYADFREASFAPAPQSDFILQSPAPGKRVRRLVPPPPPLPTELYGRRPTAFHLQLADGQVLHRDQMFDRPHVLAWFRRHPTCWGGLQQIEQVKSTLPEASGFAFYAIATEPLEVSSDVLSRNLGQLQISLPLARDTHACGRDVFGIPELPAVIVLDANGRVQSYLLGNQPNLGAELGGVLKAIAQGQQPAAEILARFEQAQRTYRQDLIAAGATGLKLASVGRPARSAPRKLHMERAWTTAEVRAPGWLVADDAGRVLALSGARSMAMLDDSGRVVRSEQLRLPAEASVSHLAVRMDSRRRPFVLAWSIMGRQAFVLDDQWNLATAYPPLSPPHPGQPHPGIADARLEDLDGDGHLELYVAFAGESGVQRADLLGQRVWSNRVCPDVRMLAASASPRGSAAPLAGTLPILTDPAILAVGPSGMLYPLTADGRDLPPVPLADWPLLELHAWRGNAESRSAFCGLALNNLGQRVALGLDAAFSEAWTYAPTTEFIHDAAPIVISGALWEHDPGHWILASSDGSLHVIGHDGALVDSFQYGAPVRGLALLPGNEPLLVVSTDDDVSAWRLSR